MAESKKGKGGEAERLVGGAKAAAETIIQCLERGDTVNAMSRARGLLMEAEEAEGDGTAVRGHMERLGFSHTGTGGGCTAYERTTDHVQVLVTDLDMSAPESMDEPVAVGVYDEEGNVLCTLELENLRAIKTATTYA